MESYFLALLNAFNFILFKTFSSKLFMWIIFSAKDVELSSFIINPSSESLITSWAFVYWDATTIALQ